ncbi:MAG: AIR synthase-related protein [Desulfobacterales bacterium]|jgi:hydrogenase expression/formation protein HypE
MFRTAVGNTIHALRDPTRGGVGTALNEIAEKSESGIIIDEEKIPLKGEVAGACELLGFDPLYLANEGKLLAFVSPDSCDAILEAIKFDPYGRAAAVIGEVVDDHPGKVILKTRIGGKRIVDMLAGEQLPRICEKAHSAKGRAHRVVDIQLRKKVETIKTICAILHATLSEPYALCAMPY